MGLQKTAIQKRCRVTLGLLACAGTLTLGISASRGSLGVRNTPPSPPTPAQTPAAPESYPASDTGQSEALKTPQTPSPGSNPAAGSVTALQHDLELDSDTEPTPAPTTSAPVASPGTASTVAPAPLAKDLPFEDLTPEQSSELSRKLRIVEEILSRHHRLYDAKSARVSELYRALAQLEGPAIQASAPRSK